jgi:hypothetical protein
MSKKSLKLSDRIRALTERHARLNARIRDELSRPRPDDLRVQTLKRMKLKAKDQIAYVTNQMQASGNAHNPGIA